MTDTWAQLATLAAFICFQVGERIEASGFVAAFTGGLAFSLVSRRGSADPLPTQVSDATGQLLELLVFAMFGAFAVIDGWLHADWRVVAFAVVALFAVRIVAVFVALVRTGVPVRQQFFIGWFGPRGIGTVDARSAGGQPWRNPERRGDGRIRRSQPTDAEPGTAQRHGGAGNPDVGGSALAAQGRVRRREQATSRLRSDHEMSR